MGSRRSSGYGKVIRKSKVAGRSIRKVEKALDQNKPAKIIVLTAVDVIAASEPSIGALVATYKLSRRLYDISSEAYKEYKKTGDTHAAAQKAAEVTMKHAASVLEEHIISNVVDVGWDAIKKSKGINTSEMEDRILTSTAKNILKEAIPI